MKQRIRRRRQGGWILLMVMLLLLAIALAVTGYYTQTEDHLFTSQSMAAAAIANSRAELGAQDAVARMRAGNIPLTGITFPCNDTPPNNPLTACTGPGFGYWVAPIDNGSAADLRVGGGLQYEYVVYKPLVFGASQNLFAIRSRGYYGYTLTSANLYSSEIEVTIELGSGSNQPCNGAQDYGGCGGG